MGSSCNEDWGKTWLRWACVYSPSWLVVWLLLLLHSSAKASTCSRWSTKRHVNRTTKNIIVSDYSVSIKWLFRHMLFENDIAFYIFILKLAEVAYDNICCSAMHCAGLQVLFYNKKVNNITWLFTNCFIDGINAWK